MSPAIHATAAAVNRETTFADHAAGLRRLGWAVLPANGKRPARAGFSKWRCAPSLGVVEQWAEQEPAADIVIVPGLSRTPDGRQIVTLDADDAAASEWVTETFGATPGRTRTRKGAHHHYSYDGPALGRLHGLRAFGRNVDVKHGQGQAGIVVAPPSRHEDDCGFRYEWDGCDASVIGHLPRLDPKQLERFAHRPDAEKARARVVVRPHVSCDNILTAPPVRSQQGFRDGSRGLALNDHLCKHVGWCSDLDDLLDVAETWHSQHVDAGMEALDSAEIVDRTRQVWRDAQAGKLGRSTDAHRELSLGENATKLLQVLRVMHPTGRDAFAIAPDGMARARVIGRWSPARYRSARDELLKAGFVRLVRAAEFRAPPLYAFPS